MSLPKSLTANFELTEDGWWVVTVSEMPDVNTQGATFTEACEMLADAVLLMATEVRERSRIIRILRSPIVAHQHYLTAREYATRRRALRIAMLLTWPLVKERNG